MTFKLDLLPAIEDLKRVDVEGQPRVYQRGDRIYRSVTSVLSKLDGSWLEEWKRAVGQDKAAAISKAALARGSMVHSLCESYLKGQDMSKILPIHKEDFRKAKQLLDKYLGTVKGIEHQLYSDTMEAAGTADLLGEWGDLLQEQNRKMSIIDFKTSKKQIRKDTLQKYFLQLGCYANMVEEIYKIHIPRLVIVSIEAEHPVPVQYVISGSHTEKYKAKARQFMLSTLPKKELHGDNYQGQVS